jgi:hypothetical protein
MNASPMRRKTLLLRVIPETPCVVCVQ